MSMSQDLEQFYKISTTLRPYVRALCNEFTLTKPSSPGVIATGSTVPYLRVSPAGSRLPSRHRLVSLLWALLVPYLIIQTYYGVSPTGSRLPRVSYLRSLLWARTVPYTIVHPRSSHSTGFLQHSLTYEAVAASGRSYLPVSYLNIHLYRPGLSSPY